MRISRLMICCALAISVFAGTLIVLDSFAVPDAEAYRQDAIPAPHPDEKSLVPRQAFATGLERPALNRLPSPVINSSSDAFLPAQGKAIRVWPKTSHRLIVLLADPPLAAWGPARPSGGRLNLQSAAAQRYIDQLQSVQAEFVHALQTELPGAAISTYRNEEGQLEQEAFQVVLNAIVVDPGTTPKDAARRILARMPGVKGVYLDYAHTPLLYTSTVLINAPALWEIPAVGGRAKAGQGIKIASMDGGVHKDAPMFDGTGFRYPPGFPRNGLGLTANNNGKIIASRVYFRTWDPPAPGDANPWPGEQGTSHGVHTAGIAAGNIVSATYAGFPVGKISGVAPAAWVMSYRVFYESVQGIGSFFTAEGIAALEDIVKDGADVVNNSWGGGPSSIGGEFDPLDLALINTARAGVFVVMAAGNSGPNPGTTDHPSADYMTVAASTTSGTFVIGQMSVIAPQPVSPTLQSLPYGVADFGPPIAVGSVFTHVFVSAFRVDPENFEGCEPWAGTPFAGKAALISRGKCTFANKVYYAQQAGAEFVVIYNHADGGDAVFTMGCGGEYCDPGEIQIPSIFIGHTAGTAMVAWHERHGDASVLEVRHIAHQAGREPDRIVGFSSRGPGVGLVLKPDIAAPGVSILSQGYAPGVRGEARHLGFGQASGTSMAAPHVAGAAALLRQVHPGWSNAYIKSALMSTAKFMGIYNDDGSPAQPLDMGAGRLDLTHAADPGVILEPPSVSLGQVLTGTTAMLDIRVTSVATRTETYTLTTLYTAVGFTLTTQLPGFEVTPVHLTLAPGAVATITVKFDPRTSTGIGDNQGYVLLQGEHHQAHLPAWARVVLPQAPAEILILDNDGSASLGNPDYLGYYTRTLENLGYRYTVLDLDAMVGNQEHFVPHPAELAAYKTILYFTGDNYQPNGSFAVPTPLTARDMDRLTEYANAGGHLIAMGQDLASVLGVPQSSPFFYGYVLGGDYLQDSVTGNDLPALPIVPFAEAWPAFEQLYLDLRGRTMYLAKVKLTGDQQVTPVVSSAAGVADLRLDTDTRRLEYQLEITTTVPVTITAAHIHQGAPGEEGPVLHTLFTGPQMVTAMLQTAGALILAAEEVDLFLAGELYVNVHTVAHPAGELRGQILPTPIGDGASNQAFIDELATPAGFPAEIGAFWPVLRYPGPYNLQDGVVALAHRDQPSLEYPGISYLGRSLYTTFGLEGVNNRVDATPREQLMQTFMQWLADEPTVAITETTPPNTSHLTTFEATLTSNITDATGVLYRWDFGDGSPFAGPYDTNVAGHTYTACGNYTIRVEVIDLYGNRAIGVQDIDVQYDRCPSAHRIYLPLVKR